MYPERSVVKDLRVLTEQFIPSRVLHRDGQLKAIRDNVAPMIDEQTPRNTFIHGFPGTGKTCISRYVCGELSSYSSSVLSSYTNCWENPSRFRILYNILRDIGNFPIVHRKGTPTDEILEMIGRSLHGKQCTVILDEVDKIDDDMVLYDLLGLKNICLILIANSRTALYNVDPRIRSRLASLEGIEFPPYNYAEIVEILEDRAEWGLFPGAVKKAQLERIARLGNGDCRASIEMLRVAAEEAERKGLDGITDDLVGRAVSGTGLFRSERSEAILNDHQKLILGIVSEAGSIDSGELFRRLSAASEKGGLEKIVDRTFRNYTGKLVRYSMLRSSGKGRWRVFSLPEKG